MNDSEKPVEGIAQVVRDIVGLNEKITRFWSRVFGWAPLEAAHLLSKSRLDRQVSLSRTLSIWVELRVEPENPEAEGRLILAWANLGAFVEGTLKWLLAVVYDDYKKYPDAFDKKGKLIAPDGAMLAHLRKFFVNAKVWMPDETHDAWIQQVQSRRNAIHAFRDRELGTFDEFEASVRCYREMLANLEGRVPYPDGHG